jgi:hypothetical protein
MGFSRGMIPALIIGGFIIIIGVTYSFGMDFGQMVGGWGENFGESMGRWGENFGEYFSDWGSNFGSSIGASVLVLIGLIIIASQYARFRFGPYWFNHNCVSICSKQIIIRVCMH